MAPKNRNAYLPVVEEDVAVLGSHFSLDLGPVAALQYAQKYQEVTEEQRREHTLVQGHLSDHDACASGAHIPVQRAVPQPQPRALRESTPRRHNFKRPSQLQQKHGPLLHVRGGDLQCFKLDDSFARASGGETPLSTKTGRRGSPIMSVKRVPKGYFTDQRRLIITFAPQIRCYLYKGVYPNFNVGCHFFHLWFPSLTFNHHYRKISSSHRYVTKHAISHFSAKLERIRKHSETASNGFSRDRHQTLHPHAN